MKKSKLKLEKFTILKLKNLHSIFGGIEDGDGTKDTHTVPMKCIERTDRYVPTSEIEEGG